MNPLAALIRVSFRAMLSNMRLGSQKSGARRSGGAALGLLAALSLFISFTYSLSFGTLLFEAGAGELLLPLMAIFACLLGVCMTAFSAGGFLFGSKDSDLLLSLPLSAFSVMLAKQMALYLNCLVFCGLFLLPASVAYVVFGGSVTLCTLLTMALSIFFVPVLAAALCLIVGFVMSFFSARMGGNKVIGAVIAIAFFMAIFVVSTQVNNFIAGLLTNREQFQGVLNTWLLPFGLILRGMEGSFPALPAFLLITAGPFLLLVWACSARYKSILSLMRNHSLKNDYRLGELKAGSPLSALYRRELKRYFGTTLYLLNTGMGALLLLLGAGYLCFAKGEILPMVEGMGGLSAVLPLGAAMAGVLLCTVDTTCISISLEGKNFWILREAPVSPPALFLSKLGVTLTVGWPTAILAVTAVSIAYGLSVGDGLSIVFCLLCLSLFVGLFGLVVNLAFPKLDWESEMLVIKQSAAAMLGLFGPVIAIGLAALLWLALGELLGLALFALCYGVVLLAGSLGLWRLLLGWGAKRLTAL